MDSPHARSVTCPTCEASVPVSLPASARDLRVEPEPDQDLDDAVETEPRTRRLAYTCERAHAVYVYFEW